jgi:DNA processing protein
MGRSNDCREWLTLTALPGLGCTLSHRLLTVFGSPGQLLAAGKAVARVDGVGSQLAAVFSSRKRVNQARCWADAEYGRICRQDVQLLCYSDPDYPDQLRTIHDPPLLLYCHGNLACLQEPSIAMVGSRAATSYGKRVSSMLAGQLARAGIVVVSGLAMGIDGQAHAGVLAAGGTTVAVLGCGLDVVYPRFHAALYEQIREHGLLLSEYPLGTRPEGFRFPARNRIISGLTAGVIVVEATRRSGSLITARMALEQGREVFAVPGRIDSKKSEGCHWLLQQGAHLAQSGGDVLNELQLAATMYEQTVEPQAGQVQVSDAEQQLLACLDVYSRDIDELAIKSGFEPAVLHDLLLHLELKGLIRQLPGQQYERIAAGL